MFRYDDTGRIAEAGEKINKVVTERRNVVYTFFTFKKGRDRSTRYTKVASYQKETIDKLTDTGWSLHKTEEIPGWEIVEERILDPQGPNKGLFNG